MKQYIGTKIINAKPMDRLAYNVFRGWKLPDDENGADEGYLVEYKDGGEPNTKEYKGYVSWSPKEQFENAYKQSGEMSFGDAITYLKLGYKVTRKGWNGKEMFLILVEGTDAIKPYPNTPYDNVVKHTKQEKINILPHIDMHTAQGDILCGWLASQTDMLSKDWEIV